MQGGWQLGSIPSGSTKFGLKVFMDAHWLVTPEEGDRYPLGPPILFLSSTVGSCAALLMPMSEVRAFPGEPDLLRCSSNWQNDSLQNCMMGVRIPPP
jgi:hypothetical protein